jgi:hypothetical protein
VSSPRYCQLRKIESKKEKEDLPTPTVMLVKWLQDMHSFASGLDVVGAEVAILVMKQLEVVVVT